MQVSQGKDHHVAVRSLAFKWLRIIYRCWKNRVVYAMRLTNTSERRNPINYTIEDVLPKSTAFAGEVSEGGSSIQLRKRSPGQEAWNPAKHAPSAFWFLSSGFLIRHLSSIRPQPYCPIHRSGTRSWTRRKCWLK